MIIGESAYTAVPTEIINYCSDGSVKAQNMNYAAENCKSILSGALTADTYKSVLSVASGRGVLMALYVYTADATERTVGIKLTLDGTDVFDAVSSAISAENQGLVVIGAGAPTVESVHSAFQPTPFASSLDIQIKSSLSETDKIGIKINYILA